MFRPPPIVLGLGLVALGPNLPAQVASGNPDWVIRGEALEIALPQSERLGLVGLGAMRIREGGYYLGPLLLGALRGERGGFFAAGLEGGWRAPLAPHWGLSAGLCLGGGGGAGAPVGGGFFLRPRLGLDWQWGNQRLGLDLSRVRFPGGAIASSQLLLRWEWVLPHLESEPTLAPSPGFLEVRGLRHSDPKAGHTLDRLGIAWGRFLDDTFFLHLEGSGAARGQHAGYMDGFGGVGARTFLDDRRRLALRAQVGVGSGGGGGLDTGGGWLLKGSAGFQFQVTPNLYVLAEAGRLAAPRGSFRGMEYTLGAGLAFGLTREDAPTSRPGPEGGDREWWFSAGFQHWGSATRRAGAHPAFLEQLALKVEVPLAAGLYATGQTGWATGGGAGAWATGLLGLGAESPPWHGHRLRAELAAGAGGGGGVESRGGALAQGMAGWTWDFAPRWRAHLLAGRVWSLRRGFDSPVIEAGFGFRTGFRATLARRP